MFSLKLTRGDGLLLDESIPPSISVYNHEIGWVPITTPVYDDITGYWSFSITDPIYEDPLGYFIYYSCTYGILTQYPYKYKTSEQRNSDDLIYAGTYEDVIPYYSLIINEWIYCE
jgi:hypothetical protein